MQSSSERTSTIDQLARSVQVLAFALAFAALVAPASAAPARLSFAHGDRLMLMAADGSNRAAVVARRGLSPGASAWSPDGSEIAFDGWRANGSASIYLVRSDGSALRRLSRGDSSTYDASPSWSPDGTRIAFTRVHYFRSRIESFLEIVARAGGKPTVVHHETDRKHFASIAAVAWAPDGKHLVFTRSRLDRHYYYRPSMYTTRPDGSGVRLLARDAQDAAFSPDGRRIAYSGTKDHNGDTCGSDECSWKGELYVMDANGAHKHRLTRNRGDDGAPSWSADGRRIAFASDRNFPFEYDFEVYSIRPDGGCLTWLTNGSPASTLPAWEPGALRQSDPGGCGATPRPPLVSVDLSRARAFHVAPVWWLGTRFGSKLLDDEVEVDRHGVYLEYGDCAHFSESSCAASFELDSEAVCREVAPLIEYAGAAELRPLRGAIAVTPRQPDASTTIFTGRTALDVDLRRPRRVAKVAADLRRLGAGSPPAHLPRAAIPRRDWRPLDRAARALRRTGSVRRAARVLHKRPDQIRERVALRRKLIRLGARRLRCRRG
jgi:Tol biopolymer transport system component